MLSSLTNVSLAWKNFLIKISCPGLRSLHFARRRDVYREFRSRFLREWELRANAPELRLGHLRGKLTAR